jgi:hypothetical protein
MNAHISANIASLTVEATDLCMETLLLPPPSYFKGPSQGVGEHDLKRVLAPANEGQPEDSLRVDVCGDDQPRPEVAAGRDVVVKETSWPEMKAEEEEDSMAGESEFEQVGQLKRHCKTSEQV